MTRPSAKVIRLDRAPAPEPERDAAVDRAKGSFKLDLIETVAADPLLEGSDVEMIVAYASVMTWPKREAWLSISRARAKTGLSERQISKCRLRLSGVARKGENKAYRPYLVALRQEGLTTIYRVDNPWLENSREHVAMATDFYREKQADRQKERRRASRVPAKNADTGEAMSHSHGVGNVPAINAGNNPSYTPQYLALKEGTPSNGYAVARDDDPFRPFPIPVDASEADHMLSEIIGGRSVSEMGRATLRARLSKGELTAADVERWRAIHDGE